MAVAWVLFVPGQRPKLSTITDFWRLIWHKDVNRIVMLTGLCEMGKRKCQEYWPKDVGATKEFGAFVVTTVLEDEYADYAYRKLRVSYKKEERVMHHFHFLSWTDKSRPDHTFPLLAFLRRVRGFDSEALGPLVVHCRPRLDQLFNDHGDYINAVSVDGYKSRDAYILTQMPLPETVSDFLHMAYNSYGTRSNAIVMLNELDEDDLTCATYWPTEVDSPVEFGGLTVSLVSEDKQQHRNIIIRDLDISTSEGENEQPHRVRQFQLTNCWSKDSPFPKKMGVLLDLMELVTRWQQQSEVTPVTVHCLNGVERSAMFAMASYLVDMLKVEQIVDVYLACRFITSKCPLALPSLEQYQFLFELAGSFMSDFETYSNFK
ncbi:hypothetical protein CAPTEDRAFT_188503 [Capitella teleta]|uniref:Tyrosine-protein phosphatase domain-containing protein n=1 Tax=Capitella teleta TaxID=283909 RepID=R7T4B4_CAPTE|nr:hypothetical protein CAPTEDRAFT_188503 [Capitella teleta]|eukprot:ELT87703.1 hypothetical protein CAPTEDRAFT_188503 [Capitella teleta]